MFQKSKYTKKKGKEEDIGTNYDWEHIKNFFIWTDRIRGQTYFIDVDKDGQVTSRQVNGRQKYNKFVELWRHWNNEITKAKDISCFEYPVWDIVKEYKDVITGEILAGIPLVLVFLLCAFSTELRTIKVSPIVFIIPALILAAFLLSLYRVKKRTKFHKIYLINDGLKVNFIDGSIKELPFQNIKRYAFDVNAYSSFIVFSDNTKLVHLERVSYWPILREHLLSKLQLREKT